MATLIVAKFYDRYPFLTEMIDRDLTEEIIYATAEELFRKHRYGRVLAFGVISRADISRLSILSSFVDAFSFSGNVETVIISPSAYKILSSSKVPFPQTVKIRKSYAKISEKLTACFEEIDGETEEFILFHPSFPLKKKGNVTTIPCGFYLVCGDKVDPTFSSFDPLVIDYKDFRWDFSELPKYAVFKNVPHDRTTKLLSDASKNSVVVFIENVVFEEEPRKEKGDFSLEDFLRVKINEMFGST